MFLLKERAKLQRQPQERTTFKLAKRLFKEVGPLEEGKREDDANLKRKNLGGGMMGKPDGRIASSLTHPDNAK